MHRPLVSVVVVNYNGARFLSEVLSALAAQTYSEKEVIVVDNGSCDDSVEMVKCKHPTTKLVLAGENLGFAAGSNLGIKNSLGEAIALLNSDAVPDREWLEQLVMALGEDHTIGAVNSKLLFYSDFLPLALKIDPLCPAEVGPSTDTRLLGARISSETSVEGSTYRKPIFAKGFHGAELAQGCKTVWSEGASELYLPVSSKNEPATLRIIVGSSDLFPTRDLSVEVGQVQLEVIRVGPEMEEHRLRVPSSLVSQHARPVINNAGSFLTDDGQAGDRGVYELDMGQWDESQKLTAFCGAAVLLRRSALQAAGLFDRDLFMYYEDIDLSARIRACGFKLRYEPSSVARHYHAATSEAGSDLFQFLVARNRILSLAKNGPFSRFLVAYASDVVHTLRLAARYLQSIGDPSDQSRRDFLNRTRVQRSLLRTVPLALLKRAGLRSEEYPGERAA